MAEGGLYREIYALVRKVPPGRVVTYGQVAGVIGGISAQMVGFALAALRHYPQEEAVPWQRVINAQGKVSPHGLGIGTLQQRLLLEEEGVRFDENGRVDFAVFGWDLGRRAR